MHINLWLADVNFISYNLLAVLETWFAIDICKQRMSILAERRQHCFWHQLNRSFLLCLRKATGVQLHSASKLCKFRKVIILLTPFVCLMIECVGRAQSFSPAQKRYRWIAHRHYVYNISHVSKFSIHFDAIWSANGLCWVFIVRLVVTMLWADHSFFIVWTHLLIWSSNACKDLSKTLTRESSSGK